MKRHFVLIVIIFLAILFRFASSYQAVSAESSTQGEYRGKLLQIQPADPTQQPSAPASNGTGSPTPTPRVLPPVGKNAGLVIGASVLVLIIIGGVLGSRLRRKH